MLELFPISDRARDLLGRLDQFMREVVEPGEAEYRREQAAQAERWRSPPIMRGLKQLAREAGLWNLFLPDAQHGAGLSNLDYAPLAERIGRSPIAAEVFNCNAPDSGNMELLLHHGSPAQRERWLTPLLAGEMRSAFAMTEPDVASSDPTNIALTIRRDGDALLLDGRKWWITGAGDPRCRLVIVMGVSEPEAEPHLRHSLVLVPIDADGLEQVRPLTVFGYDDAPAGHVELRFDGVRVPASHLLGAPGQGFALAQSRLGPGRIHHCMRLIGLAQRALESMLERAGTRTVGGRLLAERDSVRQTIARSRCEIEQARLLTLAAAAALDRDGARAARDAIGMIKIVAPQMACRVIDRAIQLHGAAGLSDDHFLAGAYAFARALRIADGPDEVHLSALGRSMLKAVIRDS